MKWSNENVILTSSIFERRCVPFVLVFEDNGSAELFVLIFFSIISLSFPAVGTERRCVPDVLAFEDSGSWELYVLIFWIMSLSFPAVGAERRCDRDVLVFEDNGSGELFVLFFLRVISLSFSKVGAKAGFFCDFEGPEPIFCEKKLFRTQKTYRKKIIEINTFKRVRGFVIVYSISWRLLLRGVEWRKLPRNLAQVSDKSNKDVWMIKRQKKVWLDFLQLHKVILMDIYIHLTTMRSYDQWEKIPGNEILAEFANTMQALKQRYTPGCGAAHITPA